MCVRVCMYVCLCVCVCVCVLILYHRSALTHSIPDVVTAHCTHIAHEDSHVRVHVDSLSVILWYPKPQHFCGDCVRAHLAHQDCNVCVCT
jgi:hypothetical protein